MRESDIQRSIMLALSRSGCLIWRNNIGMLKNEAGIPIRFGLANPGGSDLVGITPVEITADMVGQTVAVFTAIEVKTPKGRPTDKQLNFIDTVKNKGAKAGIARSAEDALKIIQE